MDYIETLISVYLTNLFDFDMFVDVFFFFYTNHHVFTLLVKFYSHINKKPIKSLGINIQI